MSPGASVAGVLDGTRVLLEYSPLCPVFFILPQESTADDRAFNPRANKRPFKGMGNAQPKRVGSKSPGSGKRPGGAAKRPGKERRAQNKKR